jgi:hypothetical protein
MNETPIDSERDPKPESRNLTESIRNDPVVFAEVYAELKSYEARSDWELQSNASSPLDELFSCLPDQTKEIALENATGLRDELEFDVYRGMEKEKFVLPGDRLQLEAIIEARGRPALQIVGKSWIESKITEIQKRLAKAKDDLAPCFEKVGRIDGPTQMYATGWLFDEHLLVTNAHVAKQFMSTAQGYDFNLSFDATTYVDMRDAPNVSGPHAAQLVKLVLFRPEDLDIAVFRIEWKDSSQRRGPLLLETSADIETSLDVAAIGYPEDDGRELRFDVLSTFDGEFQTKRLSPGKIIGYDHATWFRHDCSTLGGSSGSPVVNINTGKVVGLHCAGKTGVANVAIKVEHLRRVLRK